MAQAQAPAKGREKEGCLLFSQRGSFHDTVKIGFLFDMLQNVINFVHDAPKSRSERSGKVSFWHCAASRAGTGACGS
jgi:hypothetical protein